jgi:hypothetical protein
MVVVIITILMAILILVLRKAWYQLFMPFLVQKTISQFEPIDRRMSALKSCIYFPQGILKSCLLQQIFCKKSAVCV